MTEEFKQFALTQVDFVDTGMVLHNHQHNKRVFFLKMIHRQAKGESTEKNREVHLLSMFEDQLYKWENCLDPSDLIKYHDTTYKLIKQKLLESQLQNH